MGSTHQCRFLQTGSDHNLHCRFVTRAGSVLSSQHCRFVLSTDSDERNNTAILITHVDRSEGAGKVECNFIQMAMERQPENKIFGANLLILALVSFFHEVFCIDIQ